MARKQPEHGRPMMTEETKALPDTTPRVDSAVIESTILRLAAECDAGKTLDPSEVARVIGGKRPEQWSPLMIPVRRAAVALAQAGRLVIYRKGKPADPANFRGLYRLGLPRQD